jgi:prepilin-type N-terminal cleavage/methylation domain-containing protein
MRRGFTIIEILIATSVFTLAAVISSRILVDIVQIEKRTSIENAVYEDARIAMEQIVNVIQDSAIDYEEYYNQHVIQAGQDNRVYGINYGVYGSRFFAPDTIGGSNPTDLGVECSSEDAEGNCILIDTETTDINAGQNPWSGDGLRANAFCDKSTADCMDDSQKITVQELYLINNLGNEKIVMARQSIGIEEWALGVISLEGDDYDQNGLIDIFRCHEEFNCDISGNELANYISYPFFDPALFSGISLPSSEKLGFPFDIESISSSEFQPITPLRTNVSSLDFIISPIEDPYRAFVETEVLAHPTVTIIMTLELTEETENAYPGVFEPLTLQTTVAAGVIGAVNSYPPVDDVRGIGAIPNESWIKGVLDQLGVN